MGQSNSDLNSSSTSPSSTTVNTTATSPSTARGGSTSSGSGGVGVRRAGSRSKQSHSHAYDGRKKSVHEIAPPKGTASPFLISQTSTPSTAVTERHATASVVTTTTTSPQRSSHFQHARARSETSPVLLSHDIPPPSTHIYRSTTVKMGQSDSKPSSHSGSPAPSPHHQFRPPSRSSTLPVRSTPPPPKVDSTSPVPEKPVPEPVAAKQPSPPSPIAGPVDVPPPVTHDGQTDKESEVPAGYSESPFSLAPANYIRPPRLPLPIEEEVHTPGSPIITPQDVENTSVLEQADVEGGVIPRKSSVLSSTTVDDDDVGDNEAFANDSQWGETRVPTRLEWTGGGDKIFVTGTFCNWERKVKLHRHKDRQGFGATVNLRPGTHHVKFLVDGEMMTSDELPTTVDWINILVNYIEVVAPLPAASEELKQPPAPAEPMPIPGAAITNGQATGTAEPAARPLDERTEARAPETEAGLASTLQEIVGPNGELPTSPEIIPSPAVQHQQQQQPQPEPQPEPTPTPTPTVAPAPIKKKIPRAKYTDQIPQFLIDLDNYHNPEDESYQRAQRVATTLPHPPSLPMFLSKSILNGATPHKDDASVLIMPNHTVLNHLATSSIKHGVLATSGTTRYKRKFLTTIMYKPTSDDG